MSRIWGARRRSRNRLPCGGNHRCAPMSRARGWRSAGWGVAAAIGALGVVIALLGPALSTIPIDSLRLVVGTLLLIFGLQWLRKAVLRATGLKAKHDEDAIYEEEIADLRAHA